MKYFKYSLVLFSCFVFISNLNAIPLNKPQFNYNYGEIQKNKYPTAYTINTQSISADGLNTVSKIYNIPELPVGSYLPNTIHVKTKSKISYDKNDKVIYSSTIMTDLNRYSIQDIRSPFTIKRAGDSPLEADPYGVDRILEINYSSPVNPYDVCRQLMNNPEIEYACPVFIYKTSDFTPNDPKLSSQWYINNMELKKAWDISKGDKSVIIGIVDSGSDWKHEDLAANIYTNPKEIPGNGKDDDGNGKIDDVNGWDLVGNISANQAYANQYQEDNDPKNYGTGADNIHGTHVAGCASAVTNNAIGIASPGFNCSILPVKCASDQNIQGIFRGYEGITYAASMGCNIINCSWGGPGYSPVGQDIINAATAKGVLVVVAAGNEGQNIDNGEFYPACYDNVLCIGASTSANRVASFSNTGSAVTVYSPGQTIFSTVPNNNYQNMDGTSMASPVAAGVCALVKSLHKTWTPKQIMKQIRSTSDNVLTSDTSKRPLYYGRINAYKALAYNNIAGNSVPGIEVTSVIIPPSDKLTNNDQTIIRLTVTNFLATANNVILRITPQNNFININNNDINIGNLTQNQSKNVDLTVQLLNSNPWYSGTANLLVTFISGTYKDYQLLKIPVEIKSSNKYTNLFSFPDYYAPQWFAASSPSQDVLWACGYGGLYGANGGYYKVIGGNPTGNRISSEYATTIYGFDENNAVVGSTSQTGSSSTIFKTVNGGANWTASSVTTMTTFINGVNFFDKNNGAFCGDPKSGLWGIGTTSDGGKTWTQVTGVPSPLAGEESMNTSVNWQGNNGSFGTTKGRVFVTNDMAKTWLANKINTADTIIYTAFMDDKNGLAIYSDTSSSNLLVASTTNGGTTWLPNRYNFTANKLKPIYLYPSSDAGRIYVLCSGGQVYSTKTNGVSWDPVLGLFHGVAAIGAGVHVPTSKMRIWNIDQYIGFLDFNYTPKNIIKEIELTTANKMNFDSIYVGKWKVIAGYIRNKGNVPVKISPEVIYDSGVDSTEFKLYSFLTDSINPGTELSVKIKFTPLKTGLRTSRLKIVSDATPSEIYIDLEGIGKEELEVENTDINVNFEISPNPVVDELNVNLSNIIPKSIEIIDINGYRQLNYNNIYSEKNLIINCKNLNSGLYYLIINSSVGRMTKPFIILK